ncbi:MAG: DUF6286 domain-containing protein [Gordonia sp. (in: high G+C Gram-positive bacteria)]
MADPTSVVDADAPGALILADRVGEKIAARAALAVDGVVESQGTLGALRSGASAGQALTGKRLPQAHTDMSTMTPSVAVDIAVAWPCPVTQICADVRTRITADFEELLGITPRRVDVTVAQIIPRTRAHHRHAGYIDLPSADLPSDDFPGADPDPAEPTAPSTTPAAGSGRRPTHNPAATMVGVPLGVALLALAGVGIHDLLVRAGWVGGDEWLMLAAHDLAGLTWASWMWAGAAALALVGLWLVWLAVKPRSHSHLRLTDHEVVWTRPGDIARRTSAAICDLPGVTDASTAIGRRRARVTVKAGADVDRAVLDAVARETVAVLERPPQVRIRLITREPGGTP